jgi:hypothetical protein
VKVFIRCDGVQASYIEDALYRQAECTIEVNLDRFGWLRLVPGDVLAILESWSCEQDRDDQGYTVDQELLEAIADEGHRRQAEITRREKEGEK